MKDKFYFIERGRISNIQIQTQMWNMVRNQFNGKSFTFLKMKNILIKKIEQVSIQVYDQVYCQDENHIWDKVYDQVNGQVFSLVWDKTGESIINHLKSPR